jgi:hypothetical protein
MDRSSSKVFQGFALLLEGCFRAYAHKLAIEPPRNPVGQALYRALPFAQRAIGRGSPLGGFMGLDPETVASAIADGSAPPPVESHETVSAYDPEPDFFHFNGGLSDSARILGRIEKGQKLEIQDVYARWAAAERRRDTPEARRCFADAIVRRVLGLTKDPLPGAKPPAIATDSWWFIILEDLETRAFAVAASEVFTAAGEATHPQYPPHEQFTDLLLGARLCGHVEGFAHFPMREIMARFSGRKDQISNAHLAEEFGRAIATAALDVQNLWTTSRDAIAPGLHEHLVQMKQVRETDASPPEVAL